MLRQQAFIQSGNRMLKGGLHCHTTRSDGNVSPSDAIEIHDTLGYDFLALTDHRLYNLANYSAKAGVLIIPGVEVDKNLPMPGPNCRHCFHAVLLGPQEGNGYTQDQTFEKGSVNDQFEFQRVLDEAHGKGNLTFYCHPGWSSTSSEEFDKLQGNFAMEVWNSGCAIEHDLDTDALYWDLLLRKGIKIFGVATDDGHNAETYGLGWVCVNAPKEVDGILHALEKGAFYSTCGPEIYDFYLDNGEAVIECSPVAKIRFHYGFSPNKILNAKDSLLTQGKIAVPDYYAYIRASIVDAHGKMAWTNPIFPHEAGLDEKSCSHPLKINANEERTISR